MMVRNKILSPALEILSTMVVGKENTFIVEELLNQNVMPITVSSEVAKTVKIMPLYIQTDAIHYIYAFKINSK